MTKVICAKGFTKKDKSSNFEIYYSGKTTIDNILDDLNEIIDNFGKNACHDDIIKDVSILRTIFEPLEEVLLVVRHENSDIHEQVIYKDKKLIHYIKKYNNGLNYKIEYEGINGISFNYNDLSMGQDILNDKNNKFIGILNDDVELIKKMQVVEKIPFSCKPEKLISYYKTFYKEEPNFDDMYDVSIKFQAMFLILMNFGITLSDDYKIGMIVNKLKGMPISIKLESDIMQLSIFSKMKLDSNIIDEHTAKIIEIINNTILDKADTRNNELEALIIISKMIWAANGNVFENNDPNLLSILSVTSESNVKKYLKIFDEIKNNIK